MSYNGITRRANNTAIISAAQQSYKLIEAYIAANGTYPIVKGGDVCITSVSGCIDDNSNVKVSDSTFTTNMATMGTLPTSVPSSGTVSNGIWLTYHTSQTFNGNSQPLRLTYYLNGTSQNCGLSNVVVGTWPTFTPSTTGYTANDGSKTRCWISVEGPSS